MKVLIYSDVHGNLPAFEKMLRKEGACDKYICLGDIVNYGPWSNECVDLALSLPNSTLIMGNHEEAFIDGVYPGENLLVQKFFEKTYSSFRRLKEIENFVEQVQLDKYVCVHTIDDKYIYPDTDIELTKNYLIGHSHHQFHYKSNNFHLFNAGSVGQNRKYINEINYLVYDTELKSIFMKSIIYDVKVIIDKMISENYPIDCVNYYINKKRKVFK